MEYREPSDIEIYTWDKGAVVRDNSLMAKQSLEGQKMDRILAIGRESQFIEQEGMYVYSPFRNGVIADWDDSVKLIKYYVSITWGKRLFKRPRIAVCTLPNLTGIEKKAFEEAMYLSGAQKVLLTELTREEFVRETDSKKYDLIISIGQNFRV